MIQDYTRKGNQDPREALQRKEKGLSLWKERQYRKKKKKEGAGNFQWNG